MNNMLKIMLASLAICLLACISTFALAASYDIKETVVSKALVADRASVTAEKVSAGVTDIVITLAVAETKTVQRVILQCDATTQSLNVYYYLHDELGGKAKGATNFMLNVYDGPDSGYLHGGNISVFDGAAHKDNLRSSLERMKKLGGIGFISFEFYEQISGIGATPIAHSMLLPSSYVDKILAAIDSVPDSEGCNINGGFTTTYPLNNLSDSI
jgi:hypothetical protein